MAKPNNNKDCGLLRGSSVYVEYEGKSRADSGKHPAKPYWQPIVLRPGDETACDDGTRHSDEHNSGAKVPALFYWNWIPPQEVEMRNSVAEEMKKVPPIQSSPRACSLLLWADSRGKNRGVVIIPKIQNGNII
ncbi:putative efflux pump antibiotic resistance protein [Ilyonectria robusta]